MSKSRFIFFIEIFRENKLFHLTPGTKPMHNIQDSLINENLWEGLFSLKNELFLKFKKIVDNANFRIWR